jgi:hypothetical protein
MMYSGKLIKAMIEARMMPVKVLALFMNGDS